MAKSDSHHVTHIDQGWSLVRDGAQRRTGIYKTKKEAIDHGRVVSRNQKTELVIHNRNGRIAQKDSHGNDPFPPKG